MFASPWPNSPPSNYVRIPPRRKTVPRPARRAGLDRLSTRATASIPSDPARQLRDNFREWILLPEVFREPVRASTAQPTARSGSPTRQLDDLRDQLLRQPNRTLLEANEAVQKLLFKAQVDVNELTGEPDPVVQLIDFAHPERNLFHAINQFRIDTPGCVKSCIIPDIVLFVNGIPLVVVEAKIGDANTANPMHAAFEQLAALPQRRAPRPPPPGCAKASRASSTRTCCSFAPAARRPSSARSPPAHEHFYAWKDI